MDDTSISSDVFRVHRLIWELFMEPHKAKNYKNLRYIFAIFFNAIVTFWLPGHLFLGLFQTRTHYEVLEILAILVPIAMCSFRTFLIWYKLDMVHRVDEIIKKLDRRINESDEVAYYKREVLPPVNRLINMFKYICIFGVPFIGLATVLNGVSKRKLMYPGYFPFDVYETNTKFALANIFQFLGSAVLSVQAVVNVSYAPMGLAMIGGHVHVLRIRVSKIGWNPEKSETRNNAELINCIKAHKDILEFNHVFHEVISVYMGLQIIVAVLNMCVILITAIYYLDDVFLALSYLIIWLTSLTETFPSCYYGTLMETEFDHLTQSIYSCNWMDQKRAFKKNLAIFQEQSLKTIMSKVAGGMIHINLDSFIRACKGAYSLFALLMQMK